MIYYDLLFYVVLIASKVKSRCTCMQVILTTLLKVYVKGGLFDKSRELLAELESLGHANDEVH